MKPGIGKSESEQCEMSLTRLIFSSMVAGGVQYGWALQLSLLTPYVQTLGLPHTLASIIWLCGPVAGLLLGPTVGVLSDRCKSRFGRRRPFILTGCITICCAVLMIGFSSDIGSALGDTTENCSSYAGPRWKAAIIYVAGFWVLDFSNNLVQGPARAMMSDLSGIHGCNAGNIIYAFWMAFGNVLGYSSGATGNWHKWFPFLMTNVCCEACANLKGAFLVAVVFLCLCLTVTLICAKEVPLTVLMDPDEVLQKDSGFLSIFRAFKNLPAGMSAVLLVTSLTWLAWFPFLLYDTDWMGREIYHGDPKGTMAEIDAYNKGVQQGAFGLLLNSIVLGVSSMILEPMCRKFSSRVVWVSGNFVVFVAMAAVTVLSVISTKGRSSSMSSEVGGYDELKVGALFIFAALGFPLAILFSIPFASAGQLAVNEGGHKEGLCIGILNIAIVIPQAILLIKRRCWGYFCTKGTIYLSFRKVIPLFSGGYCPHRKGMKKLLCHGDRCSWCWSMGCHLWEWQHSCLCSGFSRCSPWGLRCPGCSAQASRWISSQKFCVVQKLCVFWKPDMVWLSSSVYFHVPFATPFSMTTPPISIAVDVTIKFGIRVDGCQLVSIHF